MWISRLRWRVQAPLAREPRDIGPHASTAGTASAQCGRIADESVTGGMQMPPAAVVNALLTFVLR
jgi:hypothetical protein